ncbi:MAG: HEAT repeat domain-containing protein [Actinobacteria bacterium]|nr:HEAT repeat domain-containing protein [Actinomycetota bacterium]
MISSTGLLVASLTALAAVAVLLVALTVQARALRRRRERALASVQGRRRHLVLEVASGEDEDRAAWRELAELSRREWRGMRPAVIGLLAKVRGRPATELGALLSAYGELDAARARLNSRWAGRRARAAYLLGLARDVRSRDHLAALLTDRSGDVRFVAARALGQLGDPAVAPALLAASAQLPGLRPGHPGLPAWVAAEALLGIGAGAQDAVAEAFGSKDAHVRAVAAQVARFGSYPVSLTPARVCILFEPEIGTKETLMGLLGALGDASDVPVLAAYLHPLVPARLRRAAIAALGAIGTPEAAGRLAPLLDDDDRSVATAAGQALTAMGARGQDLLDAAMAGAGAARRVAAACLHLARLRAEGVPA